MQKNHKMHTNVHLYVAKSPIKASPPALSDREGAAKHRKGMKECALANTF